MINAPCVRSRVPREAGRPPLRRGYDASKNLRGITSVYIKEFEAKVENNRVTSYRINAKVTFEVEQT